MYPSFVTCIGRDEKGNRQMNICGQSFTAHFYDWYIDDAINLARRWPETEVSYSRILHLRNWIRENYQHNHNIPYKGIRSIRGCYRWVDRVIHAEYQFINDASKEDYRLRLLENSQILL